jgi:hypothetical protein
MGLIALSKESASSIFLCSATIAALLRLTSNSSMTAEPNDSSLRNSFRLLVYEGVAHIGQMGHTAARWFLRRRCVARTPRAPAFFRPNSHCLCLAVHVRLTDFQHPPSELSGSGRDCKRSDPC